MTRLYETDRHEHLTADTWSENRAVAEIDTVLQDIEASRRENGGWPLHPLDRESYPCDRPKWALYAGAAGVVIATEILRRAGYGAPDYRASLPDIHRNFLQAPDVAVEPGLQIGELGILAPAVLAFPWDQALIARTEQCMTALVDHPALEITSGQTGMMHAALALFRATGDARWRAHYCAGADALWQNWHPAQDGSGWFWDHEIFGQTRAYFGACHGIAGNMNAFWQGRDLLSPDRVSRAVSRTVETLADNAVDGDGLNNWYASRAPLQGRLFLQWCHGAPGIVTALANVRSDDPAVEAQLERLLARAAELTWQAGPLAKGPGLCHGAAGNGYAFLAMYRRTALTLWLSRARRFAMHAIGQSQAHRRKFGQGRHSLMTGDAGLAIYLHHCLHPDEAAMPGLDIFN